MRLAGAFLVAVASVILGCSGKSESKQSAPRYTIGRFEKFVDEEAGIVIYIKSFTLTAIAVRMPKVPLFQLSDKSFGDLQRYSDQEEGVLIYYRCAALASRSCVGAAVKPLTSP